MSHQTFISTHFAWCCCCCCLLHLANILRNSSLVQALLIWLVIYANIANIKLHVVVGGGGRLMLHGYYLKTAAYSSQCIMYKWSRTVCTTRRRCRRNVKRGKLVEIINTYRIFTCKFAINLGIMLCVCCTCTCYSFNYRTFVFVA